MGERASKADFNPVDLLDDEGFIINMIGVVYLARRKAGEQVTFEDAGRAAFTDIEIIPDEDEAPKDDAAEAA